MNVFSLEHISYLNRRDSSLPFGMTSLLGNMGERQKGGTAALLPLSVPVSDCHSEGEKRLRNLLPYGGFFCIRFSAKGKKNVRLRDEIPLLKFILKCAD